MIDAIISCQTGRSLPQAGVHHVLLMLMSNVGTLLPSAAAAVEQAAAWQAPLGVV